ncbi:lariat debranching enzyme, C-terminal domain-containing protein [Chaetomium strumarium]|uniref:Lariat debranching enzyme, C-terminal domain-containing protein n=1 Tax=Chaetomium strumarium TaxID=1170767 RepID=A0AAJ0GQ81_9PEZI|nr:lariat debranching enzyme, C-terminal domain-containing protein [Chaetomium strumarium]
MASSGAHEVSGVRIAVEGCGHGTLNAIYAAVDRSCKERQWDGVDLLIIGGDFQAVRNAADLNVMSVPPKYRQLGDFHEYYSGARKAPYLTVFVAGNHEASSHLWELYYGGWVAPNIYYMGAANVLRLGPLRIAGMSGIWKGFDYKKPHHERLPFNADDVKSFYHVREIDVRKLLQLRTQVDICISHDWPRAIEKHGNQRSLFKKKPDFERESRDGTLGNPAAEYVLDRLRPRFWFSAHLHCKFAAIKVFAPSEPSGAEAAEASQPVPEPAAEPVPVANPEEIDLGLEDDEDNAGGEAPAADTAEPTVNPAVEEDPATTTEDLRAQLPAAFAKPAQVRQPHVPRPVPGQPVPPGITNTTTRFLALDKCLPGRKFLQLLEIPFSSSSSEEEEGGGGGKLTRPLRLQYDPEWLSILRVFHPLLKIGDRTAQTEPDQGEAHYLPLIEAERRWVEENVVAKGPVSLDVPLSFEPTAPPHRPGVDAERVDEQPLEWTNPQTTVFCEMLGLENHWHASEEERKARREMGPAPAEFGGGGWGGQRGGGWGWRGGGRGGGRGRGGRAGRGGGGGGRGRGRGGRGGRW